MPKNLKHFLFVLFYLVFILMFRFELSQSTDFPKPFFKTTAPEKKDLIVESIYFFRQMKYDPPVKVKLINEENKASYKTPEQTLISNFSAMFAKDYKWFLNTWSKEDQKEFANEDKKLNRTPEFWLQTWEKGFKNSRIEFITRIETGDYVLIEYKLVYITEVQGEFTNTVVLKFEDGRWVLTNELRSDPVPVYWKTPDKKVKKPGR